MHGAYNLLRAAKGDEWKMVFRMCYELYKWLVIPFSLTNVLAQANVQRFINNALHLFLDDFCMAYLDDILIYSEILQEHQE